jgi:hypothetical protein
MVTAGKANVCSAWFSTLPNEDLGTIGPMPLALVQVTEAQLGEFVAA